MQTTAACSYAACGVERGPQQRPQASSSATHHARAPAQQQTAILGAAQRAGRSRRRALSMRAAVALSGQQSGPAPAGREESYVAFAKANKLPFSPERTLDMLKVPRSWMPSTESDSCDSPRVLSRAAWNRRAPHFRASCREDFMPFRTDDGEIRRMRWVTMFWTRRVSRRRRSIGRTWGWRRRLSAPSGEYRRESGRTSAGSRLSLERPSRRCLTDRFVGCVPPRVPLLFSGDSAESSRVGGAPPRNAPLRSACRLRPLCCETWRSCRFVSGRAPRPVRRTSESQPLSRSTRQPSPA